MLQLIDLIAKSLLRHSWVDRRNKMCTTALELKHSLYNNKKTVIEALLKL